MVIVIEVNYLDHQYSSIMLAHGKRKYIPKFEKYCTHCILAHASPWKAKVYNEKLDTFKQRRVAYILGVVGCSVGRLISWSFGLQNVLKIFERDLVSVFRPQKV